MTENCELCGRGMAKKSLSPYWWPHDSVCQRKRCEAAVEDALAAIQQSRAMNEPLKDAMGRRHREQCISVGWRQDAMAKIGMNETWWATEVAKSV